jgi:hypothetical protein
MFRDKNRLGCLNCLNCVLDKVRQALEMRFMKDLGLKTLSKLSNHLENAWGVNNG